jgi:hypothetical protein
MRPPELNDLRQDLFGPLQMMTLKVHLIGLKLE